MNYAALDNVVRSLDSAEFALASVDTRNMSLCWCSGAWKSAFSNGENASESDAGAQLPDAISGALVALMEGAGASTSLWVASRERSMQLKFAQHEDGLATLSLHELPQANDDMLQYMQARETMFTTSRTISVSEMATTLAHEIKQPIATIVNILKAIRIRAERKTLEPEQLTQALGNALDQAEFTNSVINRIRDFTQARRPRQQLVDVSVLLKESLSLMDWLLQANGTRTHVQVEDKSMHCMGDPTMLQQVIINLLRNGVEAMVDTAQDERVLTINCEARATNLRISIRDQGHGLGGKEESLFIPFTTSKASGMGVGLNICRSFVELHQGRLWLSPNEQGGCTSHIELPLAISLPEDMSDKTPELGGLS